MCYYHQIRWECSYWRWGRFHEQCNREYRIGETCGLMLVYETEQHPQVCALCCQLQKKLRRYEKMWRDVRRWQHEGGKPATVERTCEEMHVILKQIHGLKKDHDARCQSLYLGRNTEPVAVLQTRTHTRKAHQGRQKETNVPNEAEIPMPVSISLPTPAPPSLSPPSSSSSSLPTPLPSSDVAPVFGYGLGVWALAAGYDNATSE